MGLPLGLGDTLRVLHDLTGALGLAAHLEVLGVFKHGH